MKPVRFHPDAEVEPAAKLPGIGSPHRYGTRRVFARSFPFSVVYRELDDELVVLAIAPFPRKPGYWRARRCAV